MQHPSRSTTLYPLTVDNGGKSIDTVLIYRNELLKPTETFIASQVQALRRFRPAYIGLMEAENSLPIEGPRVLAYSRRILPRVLTRVPYALTGVAASFHRRARAVNARLLHIHFATDAVAALPLISRLKIPSVVTLHGYDVTVHDEVRRRKASGALFLRQREQLWDKVDRFLCVSNFIREKALEAGYPASKLTVHHVGINRATFVPSTTARQPLVLFVGRLVEKKGCCYLIEAMRQVQKEMPEAQLAIIGFGPLQASLMGFADDLGIKANFLGRQTGSEVRHWLSRARVLCVPSVTAQDGDSEGLPTVIMEANAMGLPVVAFSHAGAPEIIRHGKTGFLYPEKDVSSLADGLIQCLTDDLFWANASRSAIDEVTQNFDLSAQTAKLEDIYSEIIEP